MKVNRTMLNQLAVEESEGMFGDMAKCQRCNLLRVSAYMLGWALTDAREAEYYERNADVLANYGYRPHEVKCEFVGVYGKYHVLVCTSLTTDKKWVAFYSPVKDEIRDTAEITWLETWGA